MLLLEFLLHSLMDLVLWTGGKGVDRSRSARRVAAFRRGEQVTIRCKYRTGPSAPSMQPGKITLSGSGAVLEGPAVNRVRLAGPAEAATGGGRGGTAVSCTTVTGEKVELLVLTWDSEMVALIRETIDTEA